MLSDETSPMSMGRTGPNGSEILSGACPEPSRSAQNDITERWVLFVSGVLAGHETWLSVRIRLD